MAQPKNKRLVTEEFLEGFKQAILDPAYQAASPARVATDAQLKDRANHTGVQPSTSISDLPEAVQDIVASLLVSNSGIVINYDDAANTLTLTGGGNATDVAEQVRDTIGIALIGSGLINVVVNDAMDTITIATTATANATDAALRARSSHTGQQAISTITDLNATLSSKTNVTDFNTFVARTDNPHATTKAQVGLGSVDNTSDANKPVSGPQQTAFNAKADLVNGTVPAGQLPSFVDDVVEYSTLAAFPTTGESGKIYVALATEKAYRWTGSIYKEISPSPGSSDEITEGSLNRYFTDQRAIDAINNSGSVVYAEVSTSSYTLSSDRTKTYFLRVTASSVITIPKASGTRAIHIKNDSTFDGTVTVADSGTIEDVASLSIYPGEVFDLVPIAGVWRLF